MNNIRKSVIVLTLLAVTIILSYTIPQTRYVGTDFISRLHIPFNFLGWKGRDVTSSLNINVEETKFNFINEALAHEYINDQMTPLLFIILDAGNFHHPKVCFTSAGYKIKDLSDTTFNVGDRSFKAHTLFTERGGESFLSFYWIVIDKSVAGAWIEQKIKQLYFSMLNKQRVGLMIRIDILTNEPDIAKSLTLARQFISDLSRTLDPEEASYILGEK